MASERPQIERRSGEDRRSGVERRSSTRTVVRTPGRRDRRTGWQRRGQERRRGVLGRGLPYQEEPR